MTNTPPEVPAVPPAAGAGDPDCAPPDERPWSSRQLHRVNELSASSGATAVAAAISVVFLAAAVASHHASGWLTAFQSVAAAVTLVMVFALQHTQVRTQSAMQRKLDEILSSLPDADDRLVHVETASQQELDELDERHTQVRVEALEPTDQSA
jgi:low affinity Fe/Cu permease